MMVSGSTESVREMAERQGRRHTSALLSAEELTRRNIETIAALEDAARTERTLSDRIADSVASFCGSITFVWVHLAFFGGWIIMGSVPHLHHIDPYPFQLLTLITSLEAIFLTTFVMISQNRQGRLGDRRNHLDLQINLLAEQENSKMLIMLQTLLEHFDLPCDPAVQALESETEPKKLVEQIQQAIERDAHPQNGSSTDAP